MVVTILTHNGRFHADEVIACSMLRYIYGGKYKVRIIRDREKSIFDFDFVVDIGFEYHPGLNRFDHHQKKDHYFDAHIKNNDIPMSSCGMVYKKYGKILLETIIGEEAYDQSNSISYVYNQLYQMVLKSIDAHDNGIKVSLNKLKYSPCSFSYMISTFNGIDTDDDQNQMMKFIDAMNFAINYIKVFVRSGYGKSIRFNDDYKIILKSYANRTKYDINGKILVMDEKCVNWRSCIYKYERENKNKSKIIFLIYISNNKWNLRTYESNGKKRGIIRDDVKIEGITFIHKYKFIAVGISLTSVVELSKASMIENKKIIISNK
jgi:uncharacterized UPF0160 family protein